MIRRDEIVYWLAINDKRGIISHYLLEYIISKYESLKNFWYSTKKEIKDMGFRDKDAETFIDYTNSVVLAHYRDTLDYIRKNNIKIIRYTDDEYPEILKISGTYTHEPPVVLFRKGLKIDFYKSAAIVGTRNASYYARKKARAFARELSLMKFWIISGLARGIDTEAHEGALEVKGGKTIAVLPWMDPITPLSNEDLSRKIVRNGCLLSEKIFHKGSSMKYPYIERNRITSGLSNFIIAIQSGPEGGTIRQVDFAADQKKPIYTLYPQQNVMPNHLEGFNILVKKGAKPINNISDIENIGKYESIKRIIKSKLKIDTNSYKLIYGYDEDDAINNLIKLTNMPASKEKLKIVKLFAQNIPDDTITPKYFLIHNPEWEKGRPSCPRCGSYHVESRGHTWHCMTCNRYFTK